VIGYPTETVYGLGGWGLSEKVYERISKLKKRSSEMPFLLLINSPASLEGLVTSVSRNAELLMRKFWPGPLTLIFKAAAQCPAHIREINGRIGLRVSSDPICSALLDRWQGPLISTSANPAGKPPARTAEEIYQYFNDDLDAVIDGGGRQANSVSTIVDVSGKAIKLIRKGAIDQRQIEETIEKALVKAGRG